MECSFLKWHPNLITCLFSPTVLRILISVLLLYPALSTAFISPKSVFHFLFGCVFVLEMFFKRPVTLGCPLIFNGGSPKGPSEDLWVAVNFTMGWSRGAPGVRLGNPKPEYLIIFSGILWSPAGGCGQWVLGLTAKNSKVFSESHCWVVLRFYKAPRSHFRLWLVCPIPVLLWVSLSFQKPPIFCGDSGRSASLVSWAGEGIWKVLSPVTDFQTILFLFSYIPAIWDTWCLKFLSFVGVTAQFLTDIWQSKETRNLISVLVRIDQAMLC